MRVSDTLSTQGLERGLACILATMNNKHLVIAFAAGLALGLAVMWLRGRAPAGPSGRLEQLVRDSMDHANWAAQRDADIQFMDSVFRVKDSLISSSREELEYAIRHRAPSRIRNNDSLLREVRRSVGDLPR